MTHFAANLGFLFTELPFLERFAAAGRAGFGRVEFAWPQLGWDELRLAVGEAGLRVVQMNMDAGDLAAGERGWASHPDAVGRWRDAFATALDLAALVDCPSINVLAGNAPPGVPRAELEACLLDNLRWALPQAAAARRILLLEVLNRFDTPAYLFTDTASGVALVERLDDPALRLQFDTYHVARAGEDPARRVRQVAPLVGHVQVADHPGRHEPGTGDIDFAAFFRALDEIGYAGAVGLEYVPSGETEASLAWLRT
ncbi:MAG: TIM barrel protein [Chloroflexota bacterium]|nr:TIM barrel protein [Chloroflexota bacterium]